MDITSVLHQHHSPSPACSSLVGLSTKGIEACSIRDKSGMRNHRRNMSVIRASTTGVSQYVFLYGKTTLLKKEANTSKNKASRPHLGPMFSFFSTQGCALLHKVLTTRRTAADQVREATTFPLKLQELGSIGLQKCVFNSSFHILQMPRLQ